MQRSLVPRLVIPLTAFFAPSFIKGDRQPIETFGQCAMMVRPFMLG